MTPPITHKRTSQTSASSTGPRPTLRRTRWTARYSCWLSGAALKRKAVGHWIIGGGIEWPRGFRSQPATEADEGALVAHGRRKPPPIRLAGAVEDRPHRIGHDLAVAFVRDANCRARKGNQRTTLADAVDLLPCRMARWKVELAHRDSGRDERERGSRGAHRAAHGRMRRRNRLQRLDRRVYAARQIEHMI